MVSSCALDRNSCRRVGNSRRGAVGHKAIVVGMTVALLVFAHEGAAQEQRTALEQALVAAGMGPGDVVYVTDDDGARVRGDIVELSSGGLTLAVGDGEMGRWATSDVRRVERWDSLRNGVMVGAGVGVTYVGVGCVLSPEECGFVVGYLALPVVAGAAFVGASWTRLGMRRCTQRLVRHGGGCCPWYGEGVWER